MLLVIYLLYKNIIDFMNLKILGKYLIGIKLILLGVEWYDSTRYKHILLQGKT